MNDFYQVSGTTIKGFRKAINEFESNLVHRFVKMGDIHFSLIGDEGTQACPLTPENYRLMKESVEKGEAAQLSLEDFNGLAEEEKELFEENRLRSGLLLTVGDDQIFVSGNAIPTIGTRLGLGGTRYEVKTFSRNMRIAQALREMSEKTEVLLVLLKRADRDDSSLNGMKMIAMPSSEYVHIPMTWILSIAMQFAKDGTLGKPRVVHWALSHNKVSFEMEFPEYAEQLKEEFGFKELLIPGIRMETSPVTRRSFDVIGTFRPEGGYIIDDSCVRQGHRGKIDINKYVERCEKTVLASVRKMGEELGKKLGSELTNSEDADEKKDAYTRAVLAGIEGLRLTSPKALGERRTKEIQDALLDEFNPDIPYTEYDMAMLFMHLPDRIDPLTEETKKNLRSICKNAAFLNYKPSRTVVLPD